MLSKRGGEWQINGIGKGRHCFCKDHNKRKKLKGLSGLTLAWSGSRDMLVV